MKGIEWIKLATVMCEDEKMRLIDAMEDRDPAFYLWIRLLLQAGKVNDNGLIYLKEDVPYTNEMLSILFSRPLATIEKVLKIFESFKMIEIYDNNIIKICNWEKHQNIEGMKRVREGNRERVKNFREKKKNENEFGENENSNLSDIANNTGKNSDDANKISDNKNCNANVTLKKEKREIDNKNKKKNIEREERLEKNDLKETQSVQDNIGKNEENESSTKRSEERDNHDKDFEIQALSLIKSLEEAKVNIKGLNLNTLTNILYIHEEKYVKLAIDTAIERKKFHMNYINGILKNWLKEGYPKPYEKMDFENSKSSTLVLLKQKPNLRFNNFEPRQYDYEALEKKLLGW